MNVRSRYMLITIITSLILVTFLFRHHPNRHNGNTLAGWQIRDKMSCQGENGVWHEQLDGAIKEWCQLPTSDAGSICVNSEQCDGLCVVNFEEGLAVQDGSIVGRCSEWDMIPDVYVLNQEGGIDGFDYIQGFRPYSEVSCEQFGGNWLSYYGRGSSIHTSCQLPTTDANKECTNSSQCEGVCLPPVDRKASDQAELVGTCSEWDTFDNGITLEDGAIMWTLD